MPRFGEDSERELAGVHPDLQLVCREAIKRYDFKVICGVRSQEEQDRVYAQGLSKVRWPGSKHNLTADCKVAWAVDLAPWPIDWSPSKVTRFFYLAGVIQTVAGILDIHVRWGHDWNMNFDFYDQKFIDAPHFELTRERYSG